jgi:hypothetical protein
MILITGATSNVGSEVIAELLPAQAGHIRVLTRNPGAVFPDGTQKVVDLGDSDLAPVLDGVHALFPLTEGAPHRRARSSARSRGAASGRGADRQAVGAQRRTRRHRPDHHLAPGRRRGDPRQRHRVDIPAAYRVHVQRAQLGADDRGRSGRARPVRRSPLAGLLSSTGRTSQRSPRPASPMTATTTGSTSSPAANRSAPRTRSQSSARCWAATCATPKLTRPTRSGRWCPTACPRNWRTPSSSNSAPPWTRTTPSRQATSPQSRAARHAASPTGARPTAPSSPDARQLVRFQWDVRSAVSDMRASNTP